MQFVIKSSVGGYMKVRDGVKWTVDWREANTYPSKYAAKKHLRKLDNVPDDVKIVELVETN